MEVLKKLYQCIKKNYKNKKKLKQKSVCKKISLILKI